MKNYPKYAAYWFALWLFALAVMLASCGGNIRANVLAAIDTADRYAVRTTRLLEADLITVDEAKARLATLEQVRASLGAAVAAAAACVPEKPETCDAARISYESAQSALDGVELWLIEREKARRSQ
jgi:hypothetical protein